MKRPTCHHLVRVITFLCLTLVTNKTCVNAAELLFDIEDKKEYFEPRIIGGSEADIGRYSYAVFMEGPDEYGNMVHKCGGSLIAPDVVLTAAHCEGFTTVIVGRHDRYDYDNGEVFDIFTPIIHPLRHTFTIGIDNDVMLVVLEGAYSADDVVTVRLNSDPSIPYVGQQLTVMGWGDTNPDYGDEFKVMSDVLMNADVSVISNEECDASEGIGDFEYYQAFKHVVTDTMLCANAYQQGFCFGDSGGPLVVTGDDAGSDVQVGIVSWLAGCAYDELPSAYVRVSRLYDWIRSEVCKRSKYASEAGFDCSDESDGINQPVNPCHICPSGTTAGLDYVPYDWSTRSCGVAIEKAALYEAGSYECAYYSQWEIECCPMTVEDPCIICPNGATAGDEFKPFETLDDERTCWRLVDWTANFEIGSDYCNIHGERHELYCCHPTNYNNPNPMPADSVSSEASCAVCNGDFRQDMLVPLESLDGVTCEDIVLETFVDCTSRQYAEALCCPSAAQTCSICKGTKLFADVVVTDSTGVTRSCREVAFNAADLEATSADCTSYHKYEEYCCPDVFTPIASEALCSVCENGDFRTDMTIPIPDILGLTCEHIVVEAETTAETSDFCPGLKFAEALCCPSAASTCSICKGTKLFADVEVHDPKTGRTLNCGQIAYDAAKYEPATAACDRYHDYEEHCCPDVYTPLSGVSCKVCEGDVRENMPIPEAMGVTCEDIVAFAETIDETSDDCPTLQYVEALCCPSAASTCSICKGTKLVADVEVVDSGATWTCGEVAYYAAKYEATSADCEIYQGTEEYCCPENAAAYRKSRITNSSSFSLINTPPHTYSSGALASILSKPTTDPSNEKASFKSLTHEVSPSKITSISGDGGSMTSCLVACTIAATVIVSYFSLC